MLLLLLLVSVLLLVLLIYLNGIYNENYWKKRGVAFHKKNKALGVFWEFLTKDRPLFENLHDIYKEHPNEPAVGIGNFLTPLLYVRDPVNIQHIQITDFNTFNAKDIDPNQDDLLAQNLLFINGSKWKLIRQSLTPLFTSTKLKGMYHILDKSAQDFVHDLKKNPKSMKIITYETISTFCSATFGEAVLGVTTKSICESPFHIVACNAFRSQLMRNVKYTIGNWCPQLYKLLNINMFKEFEQFYFNAIKQIIRQRNSESRRRFDLIDIFISLQKNGKLIDTQTGYELKVTDELLAAQAFLFFVAGAEPIATALFATMVKLGKHEDIQKRLHDEIDKAFKENDGKITYDIVINMKYLEMVICEAMRLEPSIGFLIRKCVHDTVLPNGNIKVDKGTIILMSLYEFHHDPKYFPNPETFNPERFSPENKSSVSDMTYMPFGKGNRMCVGIKYSQLQVKTALIYLLRNFSIKTIVYKERPKYRKDQVQVLLNNYDIEFIPRI